MTIAPISTTFDRARRDAHYAAQLVAALGQTLLSPDAQFHFSSTTFSRGGLDGAALPGGLRGRLDLSTLTLELGDRTLALQGSSMAEAVQWVESILHRSLVFPTWEMPLGPSAAYGGFDASSDDLASLAGWFASADAALRALDPSTVSGSDVRVWPHHFDIARLFVLRQGATAEDVTSIGAGMTPGDAGIAAPYFYVTPWPYPESRPTPELPHGRWNVEGWYGAVLEARHITSQNQIDSFLPSAYGVLEDLLNPSLPE